MVIPSIKSGTGTVTDKQGHLVIVSLYRITKNSYSQMQFWTNKNAFVVCCTKTKKSEKETNLYFLPTRMTIFVSHPWVVHHYDHRLKYLCSMECHDFLGFSEGTILCFTFVVLSEMYVYKMYVCGCELWYIHSCPHQDELWSSSDPSCLLNISTLTL